jgi:hypothetical protein
MVALLTTTLIPRARRRRVAPEALKTIGELANFDPAYRDRYIRTYVHEASLAEVYVPARCINALERVGCFFVRDLLVVDIAEQLRHARLGDAMLKLIAAALKNYGVDLSALVEAITQQKMVATKRLKAEANDRRREEAAVDLRKSTPASPPVPQMTPPVQTVQTKKIPVRPSRRFQPSFSWGACR